MRSLYIRSVSLVIVLAVAAAFLAEAGDTVVWGN